MAREYIGPTELTVTIPTGDSGSDRPPKLRIVLGEGIALRRPDTQPLLATEPLSALGAERGDDPARASLVSLEGSSEPLAPIPQLNPLQQESLSAANRLAEAYHKKSGKQLPDADIQQLASLIARDATNHIEDLNTTDSIDRLFGHIYGQKVVSAASNGKKSAQIAVNASLAARQHSQKYEAASGHRSPQTLIHAIVPTIFESITGVGDIIDTIVQLAELPPAEDIYGSQHPDFVNRILGIIAAIIPIPFVTSAGVIYLRNVLERSVEREYGKLHPEWLEEVEVGRSELRAGRELKNRIK